MRRKTVMILIKLSDLAPCHWDRHATPITDLNTHLISSHLRCEQHLNTTTIVCYGKLYRFIERKHI